MINIFYDLKVLRNGSLSFIRQRAVPIIVKKSDLADSAPLTERELLTAMRRKKTHPLIE